MVLTINRHQLQIIGTYSPSGRMFNRKTSAQFRVLKTTPLSTGTKIKITDAEWAELKRMYFENIRKL